MDKKIPINIPNSGTTITVEDNTGHKPDANSAVTIDVDQESSKTLSKKGAEVQLFSLCKNDLEASEPIPFQAINQSTGSITDIKINFFKNNESYGLICWTWTDPISITIDLPPKLLKENKYGKLADLSSVVLMAIYRICQIPSSIRTDDKTIKKTLSTIKEFHGFKR